LSAFGAEETPNVKTLFCLILFGFAAPTDGATPARGSAPQRRRAAQAAEMLARADAPFDAAGTSKDRLLTATAWRADGRDVGAMNAAWWPRVDPHARPVRATEKSELALPAFVIEMY